MTYHAPAVNMAGMTCWVAGTATSAVSGLLAWVDPATSANAETVQRVQQGGMGLAVIGLLTLLVNFLGNLTTQWFKDRKDARDERRDIRQRDQKVENLQAEVERHHVKNNEANERMLALKLEVETLKRGVKTNAVALKNIAAASGDDIPVATFDTQDHPIIPPESPEP